MRFLVLQPNYPDSYINFAKVVNACEFMAKEIERKFLVKDDSFKRLAFSCVKLTQGYLTRRPEGTVRVRIKNDDACLTVKGLSVGIVRNEWEYPIPLSDANAMMKQCCEGLIIEKERWLVDWEGARWEIDCFHGSLEGLVIAEIELESETTDVALPPFIGQEVTGDKRYYNSNLHCLIS